MTEAPEVYTKESMAWHQLYLIAGEIVTLWAQFRVQFRMNLIDMIGARSQYIGKDLTAKGYGHNIDIWLDTVLRITTKEQLPRDWRSKMQKRLLSAEHYPLPYFINPWQYSEEKDCFIAPSSIVHPGHKDMTLEQAQNDLDGMKSIIKEYEDFMEKHIKLD